MTPGNPGTPAARHESRSIFAASFVSALACAALRLPNLPQPTGPDQGIMMRIGMGILRGHVPYRDAFEAGSPPIFFTYAAFLKLFGERMLSVNLADLIVVALTAMLVAGIAARAVPARRIAAAWSAGLLFAFFSAGTCFGMNSSGELTTGSFWFIAQRETFINLISAFALWFALGAAARRTGAGEFPGASVFAAWFTGLLAGAGFYYKYPALALFLPATLLIGLPRPHVSGPDVSALSIGRRVAAWLLGFALVPALFLLWFERHGALAPLFEATIEYVRQVYGQSEYGTISAIKNGFLRGSLIVRESVALWVICLAGAAATFLPGRGSSSVERAPGRAERLLVLWWVLGLVTVCSQREFFGYHFLVLLPPLAALAGVTLSKLLPPRAASRGSVLAWLRTPVALLLCGLLAGNALVFAGLNSRHFTRAIRLVRGEKTREWYDAQFSAWPGHEYSYPADLAAAGRLREITSADDRVFVLGGIEPVIYTLSDRRSSSRFIWSWCLTDTARADTPITRKFRRELLRELCLRPPAAIVSIGPLSRFRKYPELTDVLEPAYELDSILADDRHIYRRNPLVRLPEPPATDLPADSGASESDPW